MNRCKEKQKRQFKPNFLIFAFNQSLKLLNQRFSAVFTHCFWYGNSLFNRNIHCLLLCAYLCRMKLTKVAIFASGSGTNAEVMMKRWKSHSNICVELLICNKKEAGVIEKALAHQIKTYLIDKQDVESGELLQLLKKHEIDFIILAGYLWLIPNYLIEAYPNKIVNIHPALLPKFGGKGMYGDRVHKAVIDAKEKESGITIHYVNEHYDEGQILFQAHCTVNPNDTPETLAQKIHQLEHLHFAEQIEKILI